MIRRSILAAVAFLMLVLAATVSPASATTWMPTTLPNGTWSWWYVEKSATPDFNIGLGGEGAGAYPSVTHISVSFRDAGGNSVGFWRDQYADGVAVTGSIPAAATYAVVVLNTQGAGYTQSETYSVWDVQSANSPAVFVGCNQCGGKG